MVESLKGADLLDLIIETVLNHAYYTHEYTIRCDSTTRKELSDKLVKWTHGDRNKHYDSPERNFEHIAKISSAILKKEVKVSPA